jgi:ethanolamine ammonia-lyase small subunit
MRDADVSFVVPNNWRQLRQFTQSRIALGRAGTSLPTAAHLDIQFDHARARDAVHSALRVEIVEDAVKSLGLGTLVVRSAAGDRQTYLKRPDLGRRLEGPSRRQLIEAAALSADRPDLVLAVVDGFRTRDRAKRRVVPQSAPAAPERRMPDGRSSRRGYSGPRCPGR